MLRFLRNRLASAWGGRSVRRTIDHYEDGTVKAVEGSLSQGRSIVEGEGRNEFTETVDGSDSREAPDPEVRTAVLKLPSDINEIGRLNPQLREVMEAHERYSKSEGGQNAREVVQGALMQHNNKDSVNKTSLNKLRVDHLRGLLNSLNADARGTKAVLVQRILGLVESGDSVSEMINTAASLPTEGRISPQAIERAKKLRDRAGMTASEFCFTEAALKEEQRRSVQDGHQYTKIFESPHDVAKLLSEARAEDVAVIDVRGRCTFTEYMVIATGRSPQLIAMLAQAVLHEVKRRSSEVAPGVKPTVEGAEDPNSTWLVVDAGSVVVHVFGEEARREYDLEGLWGVWNNVTRIAPKLGHVQTLDTLRVEQH